MRRERGVLCVRLLPLLDHRRGEQQQAAGSRQQAAAKRRVPRRDVVSLSHVGVRSGESLASSTTRAERTVACVARFFKENGHFGTQNSNFFLACRRTSQGPESEIELRTSSKRPNSEIGALPLDLGIRLGSKKRAIYGVVGYNTSWVTLK